MSAKRSKQDTDTSMDESDTSSSSDSSNSDSDSSRQSTKKSRQKSRRHSSSESYSSDDKKDRKRRRSAPRARGLVVLDKVDSDDFSPLKKVGKFAATNSQKPSAGDRGERGALSVRGEKTVQARAASSDTLHSSITDGIKKTDFRTKKFTSETAIDSKQMEGTCRSKESVSPFEKRSPRSAVAMEPVQNVKSRWESPEDSKERKSSRDSSSSSRKAPASLTTYAKDEGKGSRSSSDTRYKQISSRGRSGSRDRKNYEPAQHANTSIEYDSKSGAIVSEPRRSGSYSTGTSSDSSGSERKTSESKSREVKTTTGKNTHTDSKFCLSETAGRVTRSHSREKFRGYRNKEDFPSKPSGDGGGRYLRDDSMKRGGDKIPPAVEKVRSYEKTSGSPYASARQSTRRSRSSERRSNSQRGARNRDSRSAEKFGPRRPSSVEKNRGRRSKERNRGNKSRSPDGYRNRRSRSTEKYRGRRSRSLDKSRSSRRSRSLDKSRSSRRSRSAGRGHDRRSSERNRGKISDRKSTSRDRSRRSYNRGLGSRKSSYSSDNRSRSRGRSSKPKTGPNSLGDSKKAHAALVSKSLTQTKRRKSESSTSPPRKKQRDDSEPRRGRTPPRVVSKTRQEKEKDLRSRTRSKSPIGATMNKQLSKAKDKSPDELATKLLAKKTTADIEGIPPVKKRSPAKNSKYKHLFSSSSDSSDTEASSSSTDTQKKKKKLRKRKISKKRSKKKKKKHSKSKKSKKKKEKSKHKEKKTAATKKASPSTNIEVPKVKESTSLIEESKKYAPKSQAEWEKEQSVIRKVVDEETGRVRLVKGSGEIIESIVSKEQHKAINQAATFQDGYQFQLQLQSKLK